MRVLLLAVLLAGCAHVETPAPPIGSQPWFGDVAASIDAAATARELPAPPGWTLEPVTDAVFEQRYGRVMAAQHDALERAVHAGVSTFSRIEPADEPEPQPPVVDAFFEPDTRALVVRKTPVAEGRADLFTAIGALLQGSVAAAEPADSDARAARLFLLRGDAALTRVILESQQRGGVTERAIEFARGEATDALLERPKSVELPWLNAHWASLAAHFCLDLWAAGGAPLARRALERPPPQTATLRSAQAWLEGAPGLEPLTEPQRRLGLYGFERFLLAPASQRDPALIVFPELHYVDDQHRLSGRTTSWVIDWSELGEGGPQIATELGTLALLLAGYHRGDLESAYVSGRVAFIAGAPSADRERLARSVVRTPRKREPPEATATVPPLRPQLMWRVPGGGQWKDEVWTQPELGLTLELPGAQPRSPSPGVFEFETHGGLLTVAFIDKPPEPELRDLIVDHFGAQLLEGWKIDARPWPIEHHWAQTTVDQHPAQSLEEEWPGPVAFRALLVPACAGNAAVVLMASATTPTAQQTLERWLQRVRFTGPMPLCAVNAAASAGTASPP